MRTASIYIHFPYCLAKCPYCDFVSYAQPRDEIDHAGYADAVLRELGGRASALDGREIGSIFFGGGTPSLWDPVELGRVLARAKARFGCVDELEVTVECNPTSLDAERARMLVDVGVNRLSIGVQSLRARELEYLGRLHDPTGAVAAIRDALAAGVPRVSADLIFGLPDQAPDDARAQALALADLGLSHLSCYQLTIEPGTRFGELAKRGRLPLADDARVAEAFVAIDEALSQRGLAHYEISNYAAPGEEARHNLGYWRGDEYLGLGCGAFGFVRSDEAPGGVRYRNIIDPKKYVEATRGPVGHVAMTTEVLDGEALLRERIMLGLRVAEGLDLDACGRDLGVEGWTPERRREADKLETRGRIARDGARTRIPTPAWLWTDDTAARLF
jgi:oxygen-independent coproporphyrinogen-3 oxidase